MTVLARGGEGGRRALEGGEVCVCWRCLLQEEGGLRQT